MGRIDDWIKRIAGTFVFVSALLGLLVSPLWLYFTMFVGLNLFQYSFTGFCPLEKVLARFIKE
jgi:hypothetical protein